MLGQMANIDSTISKPATIMIPRAAEKLLMALVYYRKDIV